MLAGGTDKIRVNDASAKYLADKLQTDVDVLDALDAKDGQISLDKVAEKFQQVHPFELFERADTSSERQRTAKGYYVNLGPESLGEEDVFIFSDPASSAVQSLNYGQNKPGLPAQAARFLQELKTASPKNLSQQMEHWPKKDNMPAIDMYAFYAFQNNLALIIDIPMAVDDNGRGSIKIKTDGIKIIPGSQTRPWIVGDYADCFIVADYLKGLNRPAFFVLEGFPTSHNNKDIRWWEASLKIAYYEQVEKIEIYEVKKKDCEASDKNKQFPPMTRVGTLNMSYVDGRCATRIETHYPYPGEKPLPKREPFPDYSCNDQKAPFPPFSYPVDAGEEKRREKNPAPYGKNTPPPPAPAPPPEDPWEKYK